MRPELLFEGNLVTGPVKHYLSITAVKNLYVLRYSAVE
jgi:hypothetical protein